MRLLISRLKGLTELVLLTLLLMVGAGGQALAGWYTSPDSGWDSGFTGEAQITVEISADKTTLPVNILNQGPNIGSPYTNMVAVAVKKNGNLIATPINVAISSGLASGALYYLDGDPEHEACPSGATCPPTAAAPLAYRQVAFEDATGIATFHVLATSTPGTLVLTASATDPKTGEIISASLPIQVTGGSNPNNPPAPASVTFVMDPAPVYIRTSPVGTTTVPQSNTKSFQIFVMDDFGQPLNPGTGNPVRIEMLPTRPNGGEWLSGTAADGSPQYGISLVSGLFGGA